MLMVVVVLMVVVEQRIAQHNAWCNYRRTPRMSAGALTLRIPSVVDLGL